MVFFGIRRELMMAVKVFLVVLLMIAEEKMNRKMMCSFQCVYQLCALGGCSSILEQLVPIFALRFIFKLQSRESYQAVPCMIMAISVFNNDDDDDGFKSGVLFHKVLFSLFFLMRKLPIVTQNRYLLVGATVAAHPQIPSFQQLQLERSKLLSTQNVSKIL